MMNEKIIKYQVYDKKIEFDNIINSKGKSSDKLKSELLSKVYFFDKKNNVSECFFDIKDVYKYIERINKSKLVVFKLEEQDKNMLIKTLSYLTILRKHYSPIIEVGDSNVFFFPQLNYSDVYLLRALFQKKYINETINIYLD